MTRVFLAAGVAALAIAAPAGAKPDKDRGGQAAAAQQGGGGQQRMQRAERPQRQEMRVERQAQRQAAPRFERPQRAERQAAARFERRQERVNAHRAERTQRLAAFRQERARNDRQAERRIERANRVERQQARIDRQQVREQRIANRIDRQEVRNQRIANRVERQEVRNQRIANRIDRQQLRNDRIELRDIRDDRIRDVRIANGGRNVIGFGAGGCPPGLVSKGCVPPGQAFNASRFIGDADAFRTSRLAALALSPQTRIIDPLQAASFLGSPLASVANTYSLMALPSSVSYLYPDTDDYYYRYGDGYLYRVDRDDDLISYVLPLLAGGFMPGQYLPTNYMNSYVPNYYGFNSFYPSSYGPDYGYGYDNLCNRYVNGVIYQVDCYSGVVEDVIPLYASGYGVGQYLPSSYGYYNVPYQYRDMYYNTASQNYWYAPGAIYRVDPTTQLITAVASLLAPGFSVGQPLPAGYGMYNVPMAYRDTYYDTSSAWYRYNNGYIYQVDPTTQLVTAIVASILT